MAGTRKVQIFRKYCCGNSPNLGLLSRPAYSYPRIFRRDVNRAVSSFSKFFEGSNMINILRKVFGILLGTALAVFTVAAVGQTDNSKKYLLTGQPGTLEKQVIA